MFIWYFVRILRPHPAHFVLDPPFSMLIRRNNFRHLVVPADVVVDVTHVDVRAGKDRTLFDLGFEGTSWRTDTSGQRRWPDRFLETRCTSTIASATPVPGREDEGEGFSAGKVFSALGVILPPHEDVVPDDLVVFDDHQKAQVVRVDVDAVVSGAAKAVWNLRGRYGRRNRRTGLKFSATLVSSPFVGKPDFVVLPCAA